MNYYNLHKKSYVDSYNIYNKKENNIIMSERQVPINSDQGFLEIFVFTERGKLPIPGALVTIYAKQDNNSIPIYNFYTQNYPITLSFPVAHPLGTLIRGPEYYFTTYDIKVEAPGFAPYRINNVRLFEGVTIKIDIDMQEIITGQYPIPETIINMPLHERDRI